MTKPEINTKLEPTNRDLTNRDLTVAEQILAPRKGYDATRFSCASYAEWMPLPGAEAPQLRNWEHWDPDDEMDASPNAEWFVTFTERFRGRCWLIGYRVGDDREDARVSIEGVLIARDDMTPAAERLLLSKEPDEVHTYEPGPQNNLDVTVVRFWWD